MSKFEKILKVECIKSERNYLLKGSVYDALDLGNVYKIISDEQGEVAIGRKKNFRILANEKTMEPLK